MSLIDRLAEAHDLYQETKSWPTYDGQELNRNDYLSSSEVLQCIRKSWASKHGVEMDEGFEQDWGYALPRCGSVDHTGAEHRHGRR
jgi:hypothetical protein